MKLSKEQLLKLNESAIEASKKAASLISSFANKDIEVEQKQGGESLAAQVVTEVDRQSQDLIIDSLASTFSEYDLGLLTEESEDDQSRLVKAYFWCIDPLDGTLPFTEKRPGYAVSIALLSQAGIPLLGVIADPVNQDIYHAVIGEGAYKNGHLLKPKDMASPDGSLHMIYDNSVLKHPLFEDTKQHIEMKMNAWGYNELKLTGNGGAAMNAIWTLENAPACFIKFPKKAKGGGSPWDYSATACIFNELGGYVSDVYGQPLNLNNATSLFMNEKGVLYTTDWNLWEFIVQLLQSNKT